MSESRVVTSAELQEHASNKDCWLAIHGKIYDITNYLVDHPGGDDVMLEHAGKDATEDFEYYGHSDKAREHMKEFEVGDYEGGDPAPVEAVASAGVSTGARKSLPIRIIQALLPLLLVVLAFIVKTQFDTKEVKA
eukprot:jgi/Ulvmu1/11832/UM080_0043.1